MVYVLNLQKQPLMPCNEAKARKLLKQGKAEITKYEPFTIQLLFECENQVQGVNLGVDAGSKYKLIQTKNGIKVVKLDHPTEKGGD